LIHIFRNFLTKLIIARVIETHMSESIPISDAKKMRSGVNVEAEVIEKGESRTVNLKTGGTVDVCDAKIANSDGTEENQMKLTLWGDDIKAVNVGDKVVIENGYTNEFKGEVSLTKGKFGKMTINP
jgi:replication factor A1